MTRSEFLTQYSLLHPRTIYLPRPTWHFHMDDPWFAVNAMSTTNLTGNSLVVQWLGIRAFCARAWVQFSQWTKTSKAMQCGQQQQQQNKSNLTNLICPVTVFISVSSNTIAPLRLTFLTDSKLVPMFHLGYYCHHSPYIYYIHVCVCVCVCVCNAPEYWSLLCDSPKTMFSHTTKSSLTHFPLPRMPLSTPLKYPTHSFFFWPCCRACGILVPQPGIEPFPSAWKLNLNH